MGSLRVWACSVTMVPVEATAEMLGGDDQPPWSAVLVAAVREEAARLRLREDAARASIDLPAGWTWSAVLHISVRPEGWLLRTELLPVQHGA